MSELTYLRRCHIMCHIVIVPTLNIRQAKLAQAEGLKTS